MRKRLNDAVVDALKPKAKRYLVYDSLVSCLAVRVAPSGRKTFVLVGRHGSKHATRKSLGVGLTIDDARAKAQSCHTQGRAPTRGPKFAEVADRFIAHIANQKRSREVTSILRREFMQRWGDRRLSDIKRADVLEVIDVLVARGHPYAAHHAWAHIRRLYNWAIARDLIELSPCDRVRARDIIGEKVPRQRVLTDDELARVWHAASSTKYPFGPFVRMLMVTGQRLCEVAMAHRREFDLNNGMWRLPPSRMKAGAPHMVPLSPLALSIIAELPQEGYVFSTSGGHGHIKGFSKAKRRLDATVGEIPHFVLHDLRRTVRTRLSQLRVRFEVAEMVIGHGKKGLARVYDQHEYLDEIREALNLWSNELMRIVSEPGPGER